jgi:hypothetical protein
MQNRNPIEVNIFIVMIACESNFNRAENGSGVPRRHSPEGRRHSIGTSV